MKIENLLKELNIFTYRFYKNSNIIQTDKNSVLQLRELLKTTDSLKKSNIKFFVDKNYNILLSDVTLEIK